MKFVGEAGVSIPPGSTLFDVLFIIIQHVLELSDAATMDIIFLRIGAMHQNTLYSKELLKVDDAIYCLDRNDLQACTERQKHVVQQLEEKDTFIRQYQHKKRALLAGGGVPGGGGGGGGFAKVYGPAPLHFIQKEVKLFLPPGATCWRGNTRSEWWGHFAPNPRVIKAVRDYESEDQAIRAMLQAMWMQYNEHEGRPLTECLVASLFDVQLHAHY